MRLLDYSIDLGSALKAGAVAVGIAGGFAVLKDDVADLTADKADRSEVLVLETKLDGQLKQLDRIEKKIDRIDDKLDSKVDKP